MSSHEDTAFDTVMNILRNDKIDFDRPHEYKWHEHPEYPIEDSRRFTVEIIYEDEIING